MNESTALRWPLVRVSWVDSYGPHGWILLRHVLEPSSMDVVSVGWVVQDQADRLTLVAHIQDPSHDSPNVDGCLTIPKVAIKSIVVLREKSDD